MKKVLNKVKAAFDSVGAVAYIAGGVVLLYIVVKLLVFIIIASMIYFAYRFRKQIKSAKNKVVELYKKAKEYYNAREG